MQVCSTSTLLHGMLTASQSAEWLSHLNFATDSTAVTSHIQTWTGLQTDD